MLPYIWKHFMQEEDLLSIIRNKTSDADLKDIQEQRERALKYYRQDLFGNEIEGQSQVVTSDVRDTIEWMLPQLVEMFLGPDAPCEFKPQNPNDIEAAKQETKYVRYVYNEQNNGFLNTYTWFKDALLSKNGVIKCYWQEEEEYSKENYKSINIVEYEMLVADKDYEIVKSIIYLDGKKVKKEALSGVTIDRISYDVEGKRRFLNKKIEICPVPPENFYVEPLFNSVNLSDVPFCREDSYLTEDELLQEGFEQALIDSLPSYSETTNTEKQIRFQNEYASETSADKKSRKIKISDVYIKIDYNEDGDVERRFVKIAADRIILENEECDYVPYRAITPIIMTHKYYGMSIADCVEDLQLLKSTLWRQSLNSLYLANNPRYKVTGGVELDDLLVSRPGGIVRMETLADCDVMVTPFVGQNALPMIDLVDKMREERTGVSSTTQGLDPSVLSDSTNLVGSMIMNAAMARVKMIGRIFAETGFKSLMLLIHQLVQQYEDNNKIADLGDGYVSINPSNWKSRRDITVKVGVGYADRNQKIMALERILNLQQSVFQAQGGEGALVNAQNIYNSLNDLLEITGMDTRNRYFSDPKNYQAPPQSPSVQEQAVHVAEAEAQLNAEKAVAENNYNLAKLKQDGMLKKLELELKAQVEMAKLGQQNKEAMHMLAKDLVELEIGQKDVLEKQNDTAEESDMGSLKDTERESSL